jgi:autophagy-related protein 18
MADDQGATGIVEMLFCTSLVALVGSAENQASNSPRKLQIVNTKVSHVCSTLYDIMEMLIDSANLRYVN